MPLVVSLLVRRMGALGAMVRGSLVRRRDILILLGFLWDGVFDDRF